MDDAFTVGYMDNSFTILHWFIVLQKENLCDILKKMC